MHPQTEAVQEALPTQLTAVGLHSTVHLPVDGEQNKHCQDSVKQCRSDRAQLNVHARHSNRCWHF